LKFKGVAKGAEMDKAAVKSASLPPDVAEEAGLVEVRGGN